MTSFISKLDSIAIHEAFMENILAYYQHMITVDVENSEFNRQEEYATFVTTLNEPNFNGALVKEYDIKTLNRFVDEISLKMEKQDLSYQIWITPECDKDKVKTMMQELKFRFMGESLGLGIVLSDMNMRIAYPKSLYVEAINNLDRFKKWMKISSIKLKLREKNEVIYYQIFEGADFGNKDYHWRKYIGWLNGEPVVSCTLILGGGIAGIYDVALIPKIKTGIGIEEFIVLKPLEDAMKMGYRIGMILSTVGELRKYMNLGFNEVNKIPKYVKILKRKK